MKCIVYRTETQAFTYLYLRAGMALDDLPDELLKMFGQPEQIMELDLQPGRRLAKENPQVVRDNLASQGWHLQLPPHEDASGWLDLPEPKEI